MAEAMKATRRSSIFEVPEHFHRQQVGSSTIFAHDPEEQSPVKQPPPKV